MLRNTQASSEFCSAQPWHCTQQTAGETHDVYPNSEKKMNNLHPVSSNFSVIYLPVSEVQVCPLLSYQFPRTIILMIVKTVTFQPECLRTFIQSNLSVTGISCEVWGCPSSADEDSSRHKVISQTNWIFRPSLLIRNVETSRWRQHRYSMFWNIYVLFNFFKEFSEFCYRR